MRARLESWTPLGGPVVPEEKGMMAVCAAGSRRGLAAQPAAGLRNSDSGVAPVLEFTAPANTNRTSLSQW